MNTTQNTGMDSEAQGIFGDKSRRKKGSDCDYDKRSISVFICDTDIK